MKLLRLIKTKSAYVIYEWPPSEKQASCVWLLALVKQAKDHHIVKDNLMKIQSAFMGLLGDNNDLVQDAASKGLGLVYEVINL